MPGIGERMRSYIRGRDLTTTHRLDHYLTEHIPRLVREHELATRTQMRPIDDQLDQQHRSVRELENWQDASTERLETIKKRIGRLEVKYGLGGR